MPHPTTDLLRLQRIFREVFDNPELELTATTSQRDLDHWDSVAQIKLVLAVEAEFGVRFEMEEVSGMRSAGEFQKTLNAKRSTFTGERGTESRQPAREWSGAKALVVDLDNTLWDGMAGEVENVCELRITPEHAALQQYLHELHGRGVLLAVCSKNDLAAAERPFAELTGMVLKRADFAAFTANWQDKAANLAEIARTLHIGTDALVFLDDNPVEREWVRQRLPEVAVVEHDDTTAGMLAAVRAGHYFDAAGLTSEDLARHKSFAADVALREHLAAGRTLAEFLASLEMVLEVRAVGLESVERVAQLVNKTNQFNLTTRRRTAAEIAALAAAANWWCREFRLTDRFGEHGIIGILLVEKNQETEERKNGRAEDEAPAEGKKLEGGTIINSDENRPAASDGSTWRIDTWLLSCRMLGRQLEDAMFATLVTAAAAAGAKMLTGEYLATGKNGLVAELYPRLGFGEVPVTQATAAPTAGGRLYRWEIVPARPPQAPISARVMVRDIENTNNHDAA